MLPDPDKRIAIIVDKILVNLETLDALATTGDAYARSAGVALETARIAAHAAILEALTRQQSTDATRTAGSDLRAEMTRQFSGLAAALDRFSQAANAGTDRMVRWTKVMAFTGVGVALTGIAQIIVALMK